MDVTSILKTLNEEKHQLTQQLAKVSAVIAILSGTQTKSVKNTSIKTTQGKRTMSAAARKRIATAQKLRWAKFHAAQKKVA